MPLTIYDISKRAGVSIATVSRVLNGSDLVSAKTRQRVLAVVEQYGFQPNNNAKHLKQQAGTSIAILVKGTENMLFADLVEKIQALSEAKRVTKPGGIILVAYVMNEYAVVVYGIQENHLEESVKNGTLDASYHTVPEADSLYAFERIEDIDGYNQAVGLKREKILSPDGPANYIRPFVNQLSEESYELFVAYQLKVCERPDLIGAGAHTVDILRK